MSGDNACVVGEGQQLALDGGHELGMIGSGEVGPADRSGKERVTYNGHIAFGMVDRDAAGAVPGGVSHFKIMTVQGQSLSMNQCVGRDGGNNRFR